MAIQPFLAMTAAEISGISRLPPKIGWMACHFSPYTVGLSNRPKTLPPDSLLIVNDITPIHGHSQEVIATQLHECVESFRCRGVLLDFQRPYCTETAELAAFLTKTLPCTVVVSEAYAVGLDCPVFLPPLPHHIPLVDWLAPWQGREIWLELALDVERITLTESGAAVSLLPVHSVCADEHTDQALYCHYKIDLFEDHAVFTLRRSHSDLDALLAEAEALGVTATVGLYQDLCQ